MEIVFGEIEPQNTADRVREINYIINNLRKIWLTKPDLRLGQLISNIATEQSLEEMDVFYLPDSELQEYLSSWSQQNDKG